MSTSIGSRLRHARKEAGYGLNQLARKIKIGQSTISRLENDNGKGLNLHTLRRLAKALEVTIDEIVIGPIRKKG